MPEVDTSRLLEPENPFLTDDPTAAEPNFKPISDPIDLSDDDEVLRTPRTPVPHSSTDHVTGDELFEHLGMTAKEASSGEFEDLLEAYRKRKFGQPLDDPTLEPLLDEFETLMRNACSTGDSKVDEGDKQYDCGK